MPEKDFAIARDADAAPVPLEYRDAERVLQFPDGLGDGRLADAQGICRAADAFLASDLDECMQVAELDARVDQNR